MRFRQVNSILLRRIDDLDDTFKTWSITLTEDKDKIKLFSDQVQIIKGKNKKLFKLLGTKNCICQVQKTLYVINVLINYIWSNDFLCVITKTRHFTLCLLYCCQLFNV